MAQGKLNRILRTSPTPDDRTRGCPFSIPLRQDEVVTRQLEKQFDDMRRQGALAWAQFPYGTINNGQGWVATGYREVKAILNDARFSLAKQADGDYPRARVIEVGAPFPHSFVVEDPPHNAERRRTLMKHLTPARVKRLRPFTEKLVEDSLDKVEQFGQGADLLPLLVRPVPLLLLCELLGAPPEEQHIYVDYAHNYVSSNYKTVDEARIALNVIRDYFAELCRRKRQNPGDDLISSMLKDIELDGVWSDEELENFGFTLLTAGHDSTSSVVSCILYWLIHSPDIFSRLRSNPDLVPRAVDEFLRLVPIGVPGTRVRVAMEDVEFGDTLVRKDETVLAIPHAGNFDAQQFDQPDHFNLDRANVGQHIAFGFGAHFCVGSILAKMDIEMILRGIIQRFKTISPEKYDENWKDLATTRGPKTMKVHWTK